VSTESIGNKERMSNCRLRILHVVFSLDSGGLENGIVNLCNRLDPERFAPSICTFAGGGALESRVDKSRVEMFCVERRWNNDPTLPLRLARQLRRRAIEILHTHSWGTLVEGVLAATLARVPTIVHGEHGLLECHRRHIAVQRWLWPRTDQLLAVSAPLADQMSQLVKVSRQKIEVVVNGVDTERFRPEFKLQAECRTIFGLPATGHLLGTVARLVPVKNCLGLLHAVARLRRKGTRVALALAGDGPLRGELKQMAHDLQISDSVYFLGNVADVDRFYRAIDIFVLNSHSEGMSNTILEAMASGLPIVATDVGSNSELIAAERTGIIVPAGDVVQLADALAGLIRQPVRCQALGVAARCRAVDEYSLDRMVQKYEGVYERLAGRRHFSAVRPTAVIDDGLPTLSLK
jgi:L-malate glycosyltransferase